MTDPIQAVNIRRIYYASGSQPIPPVLYDNPYDSQPNIDVLDSVLSYNGQISVQGYFYNGVQQVPSDSDPIGDALRAEMIAYWKFEEASGTRVDATGNGHDGTPINAPGRLAGKIGNAIHFDKTLSQKVTVPDNVVLQNTANLYIFGWIKLLSEPDLINQFGYTFIGKIDSGTGVYEYEIFFSLGDPPNYTMSFYIATQSESISADIPNEVSVGTPFFVEVYFNFSTRRCAIAINNGDFVLNDLGFGQLTTDPETTTEPVIFGADPSSTFWDADVYLDEFGFLKPDTVPISQEQRDYLWNSGNGRTLY